MTHHHFLQAFGSRSPGLDPFSSLHEILLHWSQEIPDRPALLGLDGDALSYCALLEHVEALVRELREHGIRPDERVAVVMPNGPDLASSVLAVACGSVCVPLNPKFSEGECYRYFTDLRVDALFTRPELSCGARDAARSMGLPILELHPMPGTRSTIRRVVGSARRDRVGVESFCGKNDHAFVLPTSGTTARPKSVPLSHANVCISARNTSAWMDLGTRDRLLGVLPLHHAHGLISGLLASIAGGASVICTPGFLASEFFHWIEDLEPTWYTAVPTIHHEIVQLAAGQRDVIPRSRLRFIRSASASLAPNTLGRLEEIFGVPVIETYGMTEASSQISSNPLPPGRRKPGSVGLPAGPEIAILNDDGSTARTRYTGRIALRGPTVTSGYEGDSPEFGPGYLNGWFITGDLGYFDEDGYLFIVGRTKEIINRGGEKVAPREVEEALLEHPAVAQAVVFAVPHERLGEDVAAAVTLTPGKSTMPQDLRLFTSERLAPFKVPRRVEIVSKIPEGPAGKVMRIGMAERLGLMPRETDVEITPAHIAPRSETERVVWEAWSVVLGKSRIGIYDDFFILGGDSLSTARVISRIEERLGATLSFRDFLDAPTIAGLAARVRKTRAVEPALVSAPAALEEGTPCPLSCSQKRLYLLDRLDATGRGYQVVEALRLEGHLDVTALACALQDMTMRHEVLRASFHERGGEPFQTLMPGRTMPFEIAEATIHSGETKSDAVRRAVQQVTDLSFDLSREPPARANLFRFEPSDHLLVVTMHHLVTDGWSQKIFWTELLECYRSRASGRTPDVAPPSFSYGRFIDGQREWLRSGAAREQLRYWHEKLEGLRGARIRTDYARSSGWSGRGSRHPFSLSPALTGELQRLSRRHGVTLFMTLLAALKCLVSRHTRDEDVAIGSLFANRRSLEVEPLMGTFANTVVLRTDLSGDPTFAEALGRLREVTLDAYRHQELPFEEVLRALDVERVPGQNSLFQTMFIYQSSLRRAPQLPGLSSEFVDVDTGVARFDLTFELHKTVDRVHGWIEYSTDLFRPDTIENLASQYQTVLTHVVVDDGRPLSQIALLSEAARKRVLIGWSDTAVNSSPGASVIVRLLEHARGTPNGVAVSGEGERVGYETLELWSRAVGCRLANEGVGPESVVAVLGERGPRYLAGLLGVLRAGGAFLLLDPSLLDRVERLLRIMKQSRPALIMVEKNFAASAELALLGMPPVDRPRILVLDDPPAERTVGADCTSRVSPADLAYVVFTSGSTGVPKGAMIEHRAMMNHLLSKISELSLGSADVVAQTAPQSFDISIWQFLAVILVGGRVHVVRDERARDPATLMTEVVREGVTVLEIVPAVLREILDAAEAGGIPLERGRLRWLICTGESLDPDLCRRWLALYPDVPMMNAYGPAECADDVSVFVIDTPPPPAANSVPIGRPIANTSLYVLDANRQPVPNAIPGELFVGGVGVGRGYLNDEEETTRWFSDDPFSAEAGARMFRTGDLVRRLCDGNLEFLGRIDDQVKVLGHRIEPGEIEFWLDQYPDLSESVVLARDRTERGARLVAYVVAAGGRVPGVAELRRYLRSRIPDAMVPPAFAFLEALPRTDHGKVDREALRAGRTPLRFAESEFVAPQNDTEETVLAIFRELLEVERIGIHDNFFDLGGHSLLAAQVLARVERSTGVAVPLRALFESPTVHDLAMHIKRVGANAGHRLRAADVRSGGHESRALSIAQEHAFEVQNDLGDVPVFNLPFAFRLYGPLDLVALECSVNEIVDRHEILRTGFVNSGGRAVRIVRPADKTRIKLTIEDLVSGSHGECERRAKHLASALARKHFNLASPPLFRLCLCRLGPDDHVLLFTIHHMIADGWSIAMFTRELSDRYETRAAGREPKIPASTNGFSAFVSWQRAWCASDEAARQLAYWKRQLHDVSPVYPLRDWATVSRAFRIGRQAIHVPARLAGELNSLSRANCGTLFITLLTTFKLLLLSHTDGRDLCVATATANRSRSEFEEVMGPLENTMVIRSCLSEDMTFTSALRIVRDSMLAANEHGEFPFEKLDDHLKEEGLDLSTILQVFFVFQSTGTPSLRLPPLVVQPFGNVHSQGQAVFPVDRTYLTFMLTQRPSGLVGTCIYKSAVFDCMFIRKMLHDYSVLLAGVAAAPQASIGELVRKHILPQPGLEIDVGSM